MWEYSDTVKEHYKNPKNVGFIEDADAVGEAGALACGDALKIVSKNKGWDNNRCQISNIWLRFRCSIFQHFNRNGNWKNNRRS